MADFLKLKETPDSELIVDVDKIAVLKKTGTSHFMYINGGDWYIDAEAYEKIKERMLHPYGR